MSKRLICLLLTLVLMVGVLAGCSEKTNEEAAGDIADKASESTATLAMYLMCEEEMDDDTVSAIEAAVNRITEAKFKTRLKLYYYTEDVYYEKLDAAFAERAEAKANGTLASSKKTDDEAEEEETVVDEYGVVRLKYPDIASYQVDIFYMGGQDNYDKYKSSGMLTRLDEELNSSSKAIRKYVSDAFLSQMKNIDKGTYAIPTNHVIGDYTYLLLNKDALEKASRNTGDYSAYTSLTCFDTKDFLSYVNNPASGLSETYYPLYTNLESQELLLSNLRYWGVDEDGKMSDTFSVLGGYYNNAWSYGNKELKQNVAVESLFENETFVADLETLTEYKVGGYYADATDANKKFAVGYVRGGAELVETYGEEYEMIPVEYPRLVSEDLFSDMFAVCSYSSSTARSMKILTHMMTDKEFQNLLAYGIEGEHYRLVETELENALGDSYQVVERLSESYMMAPEKVGNVLLTYPMEGMKPNLYEEYGVQQNLDAKVQMALGFTADYNGFAIDKKGLQEIRALSAELLEKYLACDTMEKFDDFIEDAKAKVAASDAVKTHAKFDHGKDEKGNAKACDGKCGSLKCSYAAWLKDKKLA